MAIPLLASSPVKVVKNKVAPPFRKAEFDIMFGEGISHTGELVDYGADLNILEEEWRMVQLWRCQDCPGPRCRQGLYEGAPDVADEIEAKIRAALKEKID